MFEYQWFCRRVDPVVENFEDVDPQTGWPLFVEGKAQAIPSPSKAVLFPDPGCFGLGPGPLKSTAGHIMLNTSSFVSYVQTYEITLILSKDTRKAIITLEIDVGSIPAPAVQVECLDDERMCYPYYHSLFVNPTKRMAVLGGCVDECEGTLEYWWGVEAVSTTGDILPLRTVILIQTPKYCSGLSIFFTEKLHGSRDNHDSNINGDGINHNNRHYDKPATSQHWLVEKCVNEVFCTPSYFFILFQLTLWY